MRRSQVVSTTLIVVAVVVSACGGSATASSGSGGDGATAAPPASTEGVPPTDPGTVEVPSAPAEPVDNGPDASTADVCGLVTTDEIGAIFGLSGVTQELFAGPPDTCDYRHDGTAFVAMVLIPLNAALGFAAYAGEVGAEPISGVGDEAVFSPTTQLLIFRKGDSVVSIAVFGGAAGNDPMDKLKQVGTIAAGRL
jgi:hypothetical protein